MSDTPKPQLSDSTLSRRDLMKSAAALAAVPLVHAGGSDALKVGLVGCGGRGTGSATQSLAADAGVHITALADMFPERVAKALDTCKKSQKGKFAAQVDVPEQRQFSGFDGYRKLIDSGVDVVLLGTPPGFRPLHYEACVAARKHVFMEKPIAVDATGVRRVRAAAAEALKHKLTCFVGFCWRYSDPERAIMQKIHEGAIGDVVAIYNNYHAGTLTQYRREPGWSDMEWQLRNWFHFTWLSGDHLVEQAVHSIDRMAWALGDQMPERCVALGGRAARKNPESGHVFDHFSVVYDFKGGLKGVHTCTQIDKFPNDNGDYIYGTKGTAYVNGFADKREIHDRADKVVWAFEGKDRNMYQNEMDAMFAGIRKGEPVHHGERGCNSVLMAIMGRMAAYSGQSVTWQQALESKEDLTPPKLELGPLPMPPVAIPGVTPLT